MSSIRRWAELASQNERLVLPSERSELAAAPGSAADAPVRGQSDPAEPRRLQVARPARIVGGLTAFAVRPRGHPPGPVVI